MTTAEAGRRLLEAKMGQLAAEVLAFGPDPAAPEAFLKGCRIPKGRLGPGFGPRQRPGA